MRCARLLAIFVFLVSSNAAWSDRLSFWAEDIDAFSRGLRSRHINPFTKLTKQEFLDQIQSIEEGADNKTDFQITIELMKVARKIGDGHTAIHFQHNRNLRRFPFEIYDDSGVWRVIAIAEDFEHILGAELESIEKFDRADIRESLLEVIQFAENPSSERQRISEYLRYSELLYELGLVRRPGKAEFTFVVDGKDVSVEIDAGSEGVDFVRYETSRPKVTKIADAGIESLWYGSVPETRAVYICFGGYPSFEQMDEFGQKVLKYINENNAKQLIIDLRGNGGGDFYAGLWLASYLNLADDIDWLNGVYTLVDRGTFSAATINAVQYRQLLNSNAITGKRGT